MRGSEKLSALALLALSAVAALSAAPGAGARLLVYGGLVGLLALLAAIRAEGGPLGGLRDAAPGVVVLAVYLSLQPLIEAVNPARLDGALAAVDARWLGPVVRGWRGALGRPAWFTDLVYAAYFSFYLLPVVVGAAARVARGGAALEQVAFTVLLTFFASFVGYFAWPASGPRVPAEAEAAVLGGGAVAEAVRAFLRSAEATTLDAFPSGHAAVSVVSAALGVRLFPRAAPALLGWAALVVFATVYVSVHYAVDVLAGALLGGLALLVAPGLARAMGGPPTAPRPG